MKKNRTYRTNAFLAMMLAGSFLAGTTSLASESKPVRCQRRPPPSNRTAL